MKTLYFEMICSPRYRMVWYWNSWYTWYNPKLQVIFPPITLLLILIASMADGDGQYSVILLASEVRGGGDDPSPIRNRGFGTDGRFR
jgi:hypothetical protein